MDKMDRNGMMSINVPQSFLTQPSVGPRFPRRTMAWPYVLHCVISWMMSIYVHPTLLTMLLEKWVVVGGEVQCNFTAMWRCG